MTLTRIVKATDIAPGSIKGFVVNGKKIAIANVNGSFYAIEDRCTHMGQPLSGGMMMGHIVMCLVHGAQFDVMTGQPVTTAMSSVPVKTFPVKTEGDEIMVDL
ncbi:MAG TPA: non-heme iron oxygenase ferredoxin subunit [Methanocella sp.]|nr:non-heme iron oxygenase ferredoxin subunit [Methanocella sp.]